METIKRILRRSPPEILYHYTSQEGLLEIVKTKTIWASKIQYLSDSQEFALALNLARNVLRKRQSAGSSSLESELITGMISGIEGKKGVNICVCAFSGAEDSLGQWRAYCFAGPGFAVGFKSERLRSLAKEQNFFLAPCEYDPQTQRQIIEELIDETMNAFNLQEAESIEEASWLFATKLATYAPVIKHESFSKEEEWRLISGPICSSDPKFGYRGGRSMIVPYFKFDLVGRDGRFEIARVIVGPAPHKELATAAVASLLGSHGLKEWEVVASKASYMTW